MFAGRKPDGTAFCPRLTRPITRAIFSVSAASVCSSALSWQYVKVEMIGAHVSVVLSAASAGS